MISDRAMITFLRTAFVTWCVLATAGSIWLMVWLLERL